MTLLPSKERTPSKGIHLQDPNVPRIQSLRYLMQFLKYAPSLHSVVQPISPTPHLSRPDCKAFERKEPEREKGKRERERKSFPFFSLSVWLQKRSSSPVSVFPLFSAAGHLRNVGENRRSLIKVSSARPPSHADIPAPEKEWISFGGKCSL